MNGVVHGSNVAQTLRDALAHHRAGQLDAARELYEAILRVDPNQHDALHFLGLLACQVRRHDVGVALIERSLAVRPDAIYYNNFGNVLMDLRRFGDAIDSYRHALSLKADYPEAHNNLANALRETKQYDASMRECVEAIRLRPAYAEAYNNLGNALKGMGELDEAVASYCKAIELKADYALAYSNLANVLLAQGNADMAIDCFRKAVAFQPDLRSAHHGLGGLLLARGETAAAIESLEKALDPADAEVHNTLGCALRDLNDLEGAEQRFRDAIRIDPTFAVAYCNLAGVLRKQDRNDEAVEASSRAIELDPKFSPAYRELSVAYYMLGKRPAAIMGFRHALELDPEDDQCWYGLSTALRDDQQLDEAMDAIQKALSIGVQTGQKYLALGDILIARGATEEGLDAILKALELGSEPVQTYNRLLFVMPGSPRYSPRDVYEHAVRFGQLVEKAVKPFDPAPLVYDGKRPLRIGFVSGDLRTHPVGIFLESILSHLDRSRVDLVAYVTYSKDDDVTERLKPHFSEWCLLEGMSARQAAQKIRDDQIDILVDLAGHTAYTGLAIFAWRPAPVQISWLGFFATTGCEFIDYFVGDRYVLPESEEQYFVEKPWRLPDSYLCFTPPPGAPDVGPLPMAKNGFVTFGYFGKLVKLTDEVVELWCRLLHRVPNAKLFLKGIGLGADYSQFRTIERFAAHGIDADRLILEGESPRLEYFNAYNRVDIMLSPFPYPGGTTTAEALWMGAPVLGLKGDRFLAHICESLVHAAGLGEWIADDQQQYLDKAIAFASQPEQLAALRAGLREHARGSPMCDAPRFARNLVDAFHQMWSKHVDAQQHA
ncbi:tetratricopeptide repeat protein [Paraburkholderia caballeronis]|uniref:protein O-GlcNAc transferase n=1 Tax=Paraburkholderia caballeronis TaxID=416943 RepID=A0A1H7SPB3_9BURK|nr:tetratricopeptide repeat protein [Paraburkholderia caballeronis]PXW22414.1 putative O-linked N-acetylglucosamine transferase (SPINDLY family) [Paraburkholderia caballeronis]PXW96072.1 putative O-linked N-acetylglucosamine transferase (SPINDLY family) [Paraburkholderia caballeronis]RAJ92438.1 putative O-linked N-acetylglucosamine transferase (SPINDLY family) [Paraburkholderia caballeronis]TDV08017.1 putative O-linked N-acetylglucosamine transferase (SPINDLY family) [Paraburkholderia caballero